MEGLALPGTPWAVVLPVKGGRGAKSRLGAAGAGGVALAMALDCLEAVLACPAATVGDVVVVTADPAVSAGAAATAAALRAGQRLRVVADPGGGLDAAAAAGLAAVGASTRRAVLLADLPSLRAGDLVAALAAVGAGGAALVPDAEGTGTVLLTAAPGAPTRTAFGERSASAHEALGARRLDLDLPHLRRDVDTATDLARAVALGVGRRTAAVLAARTG